jgi:hypothetical protein
MIRVVYKSSVADGGSGSTFLISTPVFGGNPLLVVCASNRQGSISTPTWNGTSFTQAVTANDSNTFGETVRIYYLVPPAPGTYDVSIVMTGNSYKAQCILLNDVNQSSPLDTTGSDVRAGAGSTEMDPSLTTANNNELVIQAFGSIVSNSGSAQLNGINWNDGQTLLGEAYSGPSGDCFAAGYEVISTAALSNFKAQMHLNGNTGISQEDTVSVSAAFKQSLFPQPNAAFLLNFL